MCVSNICNVFYVSKNLCLYNCFFLNLNVIFYGLFSFYFIFSKRMVRCIWECILYLFIIFTFKYKILIFLFCCLLLLNTCKEKVTFFYNKKVTFKNIKQLKLMVKKIKHNRTLEDWIWISWLQRCIYRLSDLKIMVKII